MAVDTAEQLGSTYNIMRSIGAPSVNSDAFCEVIGFEQMGFLIKQFPWPVLASRGEIEVPMPNGGMTYKPQNIKTEFQGPVQLKETADGAVHRFLKELVSRKLEFDALIYEGTAERFTRGMKVRGCFFQIDTADRDWENRSQLTLLSGTMFGNYFGEDIAGNVQSL